jgi:hypothetical protein
MTKQKSQIIIHFEPSSTFDEEFLEFVDEVLKFEENKKQKGGINNRPHKNIVLFKNKPVSLTSKK